MTRTAEWPERPANLPTPGTVTAPMSAPVEPDDDDDFNPCPHDHTDDMGEGQWLCRDCGAEGWDEDA